MSDGEIQALFVVYKRFRTPDLLSEFLPGDHLSRPAEGIEKTPHRQIQEAIAGIFRKFAELRPGQIWASCFKEYFLRAMSDILEAVLETARAILAKIAQKLTDPEAPSMTKLEPRERGVLREAIFRVWILRIGGYSDRDAASTENNPKPVQ